MDDSSADQRARDLERLEIYEALALALTRRAEVFDLISEAHDPGSAETALCALLGIGAVPAAAIVDLQLRRFTELERDRVIGARDELRDSLRSH